jgi:hypothetical protein
VPSLPDDPSFDHLRRQARALHRAVAAGDPAALARVQRSYGTFERFPLASAQLVVAREYGFASWARLKEHVAVIDRYRWPRRNGMPVTLSPSDEFCRLACLNYTNDDPAERARAVLPDEPHIWAAAAAGNTARVAELLAADPTLARREGGPHLWEPLAYLAYSRVSPGVPLLTARLLLDYGADPNTGIPVGRADLALHPADRGLRRGRAGTGTTAPTSAVVGAGRDAVAGRGRSQ